ncbi:heavy metal translocating P-type ATPase [[Mycoplasma] testudinis]|uniref:heavy metal translocating P-type ATPase n=1 Tax=[Mycoplasma] testudinis TaxID=33924 RepID=UPI000486269C|nr:cation-translocating P-type ATPase [[Mycoplasma] testudinis]
MKKIKTSYKKYGYFVELSLAIIFDAILIAGHGLMATFPNSVSSHALNNPYMGLVFATIVQFIIGRNFYILMYKEIIKWHRLGMNTLIGLSSLLAYAWSLYILISSELGVQGLGHENGFSYFFEVGTSIITFLLIGESISKFLRKRVNKDVTSVLELQSPHALKYDDQTKQTTLIRTRSLKIGDLVFVQPQAKIPTDCLLVSEHAYVDESIMTGESIPVYHQLNSKLIGGSFNVGDSFIAKVEKLPTQTIASLITKRIKQLQTAKPEIQKVADKIATWFVPTILVLGIASFLVHFFLGYQIQQAIGLDTNLIPKFTNPQIVGSQSHNAQVAIYFAIALIVISCPCALGLATPLAVAVGVGKAGRRGISFNNIDIFEKTRKIKAIAFDKTGTLTKGHLEVKTFLGDQSLLGLIKQLTKNSSHPLSRTLYQKLQLINLDEFHGVTQIKELAGIGIQASVDNDVYMLASYQYFHKNNYSFDSSLSNDENFESLDENTNICLAKNQDVFFGAILTDELRESAIKTIQKFRKAQIKTYLLSGDNGKIVKAIGKQLRIDEAIGQASPFDKENLITKLQANGHQVAFAGDGVNDLIAFQKADLAINMSLTNESANALADASVVNQDVENIYQVIDISKKTRKLILWNFLWAFIYNVVTIPLAFIGIIPSIIAAVLMGFSNFAIVINTLLFSLISFHKNRKLKVQKTDNINPGLLNTQGQ